MSVDTGRSSPRLSLLLAATTALALIIFVQSSISFREIAAGLILEIRTVGPAAPIAYSAVFVVASLFGFPRTLLLVGAGIAFDPGVALMVAFVASVALFICTFSLSRYIAADWVATRLHRYPVAKALMTAVEKEGFKLLILMRMNPLIPGFINGFAFGLTTIRFLPYLTASVIGSTPLALIYVYIGWVGGSALLSTSGQIVSESPVLLVSGLITSLIVLGYVTWEGRKALKSYRDDG